MARTVLSLWCAWNFLDFGACLGLLPDINNQNFRDECVREHNKARSAVSPAASNMLYMSWDEALATTARAWARHCDFKHNIYLKEVRRVHPSFPSVGENIWTGSPPASFNASRAIQSWVEEKQFYGYQSNSCSAVCGHYTQVVWATSYKVGCAVELCQNGVRGFTAGEGAIFVCNYAVGGNLIGSQPYKNKGAACSGCQIDCVDLLCRDPERDSEKKYSWTPDWDPALKTYWDVLVTRPIAVILTCISSYLVHYFYPNVFCYE